MDTLVNETIGRYQIIDEIGRGGLAVVYRAQDTVLERTVAIKMILQSEGQSGKFLRRFLREAKTLAQLSHSNIVKVLDYGDQEGSPYLVMEYLPGGTLSGRMGKAYSGAEAASILAPIAHALQYAHQHKVIHRDVKPANILINESGQPMLSDFGIVKMMESDESQSLTGTGAIVGTPAYMAPEQIQGKQVDPRSDVYSLGILFFELVTGRKPYIANTPIEITLKHLNDPLPRARQFNRDLPADVENVILKAIAKKPEDRYQDMAAFAAVLDALAAGRKSTARIVAAAPNKEVEHAAQPDARKKRSKIGIAIVLILISIAALFVVLNPDWLRNNPMVVGQTTSTQPAPTEQEEATSQVKAATATARTVPTKTARAVQEATATEAATEKATPTAAPTAIPTINSKLLSSEKAGTIIELARLEKISVINLDWTSNSQWIVDGGAKAINIIDPETLTAVGKIDLGIDVPKAIVLSPDSKSVLALIGNQVFIYDLEKRSLEKKHTFQGGANSISISPDGATIALGMLDNKVLLADASTGTVQRTLRSNFGGWCVAISPDNKYVAAGTSQGALLWEIETGAWMPINTGQDELIKSIAFSNDGTILAGGSQDHVILWDVQNGSELRRLSAKNAGTINSIEFSPDDQLLIAGANDHKVHIWNTSEENEVTQLQGHVSPVFSVSFSPDGTNIVSGANEGVIRMWGLP